MSAIKLVIGDKSRSSWSLRPWLFLKHHEVPFTEQVVTLDRPDTHQKILEDSPSGRVPLLVHGAVRVWESSAICEYAAETFALPQAWPLNPASRAYARSVAAEMHAGFADLRKELPFYAHRDPQPQAYSESAAADIRRICAIWREARSKAKAGRWLFGQFGIADAMFAPVAVRFHIYQVKLDALERDYVDVVISHPAMKLWFQGAAEEQAAQPKVEAAPPPPPKPRGLVVVPAALAPKTPAAPAPAATPAPTAAPAPAAAPPATPAPVVAAPPAPAPAPKSSPAPPSAAAPAPPVKPAAATVESRAPASAPVPRVVAPAELRAATPIADPVGAVTLPKPVEKPVSAASEIRTATPIPDPEPEPDTKEHGPAPKFRSVIMPED